MSSVLSNLPLSYEIDCSLARSGHCDYAKTVCRPARKAAANAFATFIDPSFKPELRDDLAAEQSSQRVADVNKHFADGDGCEFVKTGVCEAAVFLLTLEKGGEAVDG